MVEQMGTVFERVVVCEPANGVFAYEVEEDVGGDAQMPGRGMCGAVQLEEVGKGAMRMTWRSYFEDMDPAVEGALSPQANELFQAAISKVAELAEK